MKNGVSEKSASGEACLALEIGHLYHKAGGTAGQNSLDFFSKMVYSTVDGSSCRPPSQASNPFGEDRFVLRACADRQRTESGSPDHCRFPLPQSGRVSSHHLRVVGVAPAEWEAEEPRVRGVVAEMAGAQQPAAFAGVASHQATGRTSLSLRQPE